jgi:hypothetical protein
MIAQKEEYYMKKILLIFTILICVVSAYGKGNYSISVAQLNDRRMYTAKEYINMPVKELNEHLEDMLVLTSLIALEGEDRALKLLAPRTIARGSSLAAALMDSGGAVENRINILAANNPKHYNSDANGSLLYNSSGRVDLIRGGMKDGGNAEVMAMETLENLGIPDDALDFISILSGKQPPSRQTTPKQPSTQNRVASNNNVAKSNTATNTYQSDYIFPSDSQYIAYAQLANYSKEQVALMRNEIYARHGYMFKRNDYQNYFGSKYWYNPNPNFSEKSFNAVEKENIKTIKAYEKNKGW